MNKTNLPIVQTLTSSPKEGFKVPLLVIESAANMIAFAQIREKGKVDADAIAFEICDGFMLETEVNANQPEDGFRIVIIGFDGCTAELVWKGSEGAKIVSTFGVREAAPYGYSEESDTPAFMNGLPVELD